MSLNDLPLRLHYKGLDPAASYRLRIVYMGRRVKPPIRLLADDNLEIHSYLDRPFPIQPLEFDVPREATADGELMLSCQPEPGVGGFERGCRISEVWLMRK